MRAATPTAVEELPLTSAHVTALRHANRCQRQWQLGFIACPATIAALMPLLPMAGRRPTLWHGLAAVALVVVIAAVLDWLLYRRPLAAALRRGVYFRASGPIRIYEPRRRGATVYVGDVAIKHVPQQISSGLHSLPWGTLDYEPRVHAVIEERDADGELLARYHGYRPDADRFDVRTLPSITAGVLCGVGGTTIFVLLLYTLVAAIWGTG